MYMMEEVRGFFKAITQQLNQSQSDDQACSSKSSGSDKGCTGGKRKATVLPSSFLKKKKKGLQGTKPAQSWDREIVLFPKHFSGGKGKEIPIPRGKSRVSLARSGLIGKVHLSSDMTEEKTKAEMRSVFHKAMKEDHAFPFTFLHPIGGGSRSLTIPQTSASFSWTVHEIVKVSGKGSIYILAEDALCMYEEDLSSDEQTHDELLEIDHTAAVQPTTINLGRSLTPKNTYDTYIDLIEDEPLPEHLMSPPADNTNDNIWEAVCMPVDTAPPSLEDAGRLLKIQQLKILSEDDDDDVRRVTVRRKKILGDTLAVLRHKPWKASQHIHGTFIGEPGVDDGGPRREYFRLILDAIGRNNTYFTGSHWRRVPMHNVLAVQEEVFFHIGQVIALSLLHDGPCVKWLAPSVVSYLLGTLHSDEVQTKDIPDPDIEAKVNMLLDTNDETKLQSLMISEDYAFLADYGITTMQAGLQDLPKIKEAIIKSICIYTCKIELDEIFRGLESLGIGTLMRSNPKEFRVLFKGELKPLTSGFLQDLIGMEFSLKGSNAREFEEESAMWWAMFLADFNEDGVLSIDDETGHTFTVTLQDILNFITGSTEIPPMGFTPTPTINFSSATTLPIASTCSSALTLPTHLPYDKFRFNLAFGIKNSPGFHRL